LPGESNDGKVKEARWQSLIGLSRMSRHNLEDYKVRAGCSTLTA